MRPLDELRFIAARVIAEIRANPSPGPLLGESRPRMAGGVCREGHALTTRPNGRQVCPTCERARKQRRRAEGAGW